MSDVDERCQCSLGVDANELEERTAHFIELGLHLYNIERTSGTSGTRGTSFGHRLERLDWIGFYWIPGRTTLQQLREDIGDATRLFGEGLANGRQLLDGD